MSLNYDIYYILTKFIDQPKDLQKYCSMNKSIYKMCKDNKNVIAKHFLDKYKVNYTNPDDFIYKYNKVNQSDYINQYQSLFRLYMKNFYSKEINCSNMNISSIPILPNMEIFIGSNNQLSSFPIQPKMTDFNGFNNKLTEFPIQPKMKDFYGRNNPLKKFPVQPKLLIFNLFEVRPGVKFNWQNDDYWRIYHLTTDPIMKFNNFIKKMNFDF